MWMRVVMDLLLKVLAVENLCFDDLKWFDCCRAASSWLENVELRSLRVIYFNIRRMTMLVGRKLVTIIAIIFAYFA